MPEPDRLGLLGLEGRHAPARALLERRVRVELAPRLLVVLAALAGLQPGDGVGLADVEQVLDEHAERRAPVAQVVLPDDAVAEVLEHADQRVADDGGAEVPDVHLLGGVGRGVVDDDGLRGRGQPDAAAGVLKGAQGLGGDPAVVQGDVEEAGPADLDALEDVAGAERVGDGLGDLPWRSSQPLGQAQCHVRLVVGELRGPDQRVGACVLRAERGAQRLLDPLGEHELRVGHAPRISADHQHRTWIFGHPGRVWPR